MIFNSINKPLDLKQSPQRHGGFIIPFFGFHLSKQEIEFDSLIIKRNWFLALDI